MSYSKILNSYIEKSGLTLEEISEKCKTKGIDIHPSYISKLRKGSRPAPSEEISRVLAEVCNGDPEKLVFEGHISKLPTPKIETLGKYAYIFQKIRDNILTSIKQGSLLDAAKELTKDISNAQLHKELIKAIDNVPYDVQIEILSHLVKDIDINGNNVKVTYNFPQTIDSTLKEQNKDYFIIPRIPILGTIQAGIPILAKENWGDKLEIPSDIAADFALEVKGESMIGAGIHEGDYAICRQTDQANSGSIVVAIEDIDPEISEATLKYYLVENGHDILRAANPEFEDIVMGRKHRIAGVMVSLIRKGSTPINYYKDYISIKNHHLSEWNEVIEEVSKYGMQPSQIRQILVPQLEHLKNISQKNK